jgi:hypothetical protein
MDVMTTQALYTTTCEICEKITAYTMVAANEVLAFFESVGRARAAHRLSAMGYHEEAKKLMLND